MFGKHACTIHCPGYTTYLTLVARTSGTTLSADSMNCWLWNYPDKRAWSQTLACINLYKPPPDLQIPRHSIKCTDSPVPELYKIHSLMWMLVGCFCHTGMLLPLNSMTGHYISTVAHRTSLLVIVQQQRGPECHLIVLNSPSRHYHTYWKYRRSGNFHVKNNLCKKFSWCQIFVVSFDPQISF